MDTCDPSIDVVAVQKQPRVVIISHIYLDRRYRGKLERLSEDVALTVVSPDAFPSPYGKQTANFNGTPYEVKIFPIRFPLGIRTSTRWLLATLDLGVRRSSPDILQIENEESAFVTFQALLIRAFLARRARVILFVWSNIRLPGFKGRLVEILSSLAQPFVDFYIAGNSEAKRLLTARGVPSNRVDVFPVIGVDVTYFRPPSTAERDDSRRRLRIAIHDFVVGFVGRVVEEKGVLDLLRALARLRSKRNNIRLLVVGKGALMAAVTDCPGVVIASADAADGVLPYYHCMDVLALPSRRTEYWAEQLGRVLIEAMACGVPVVGSSSGAIPEVIGDAGITFAEGDATELAKTLSDLMSSVSLRTELARRGRQRALQEYSDDIVALRTLNVYRNVMASCTSED